MNLLNEDNVIHIIFNRIGDLIIVNLWFLLCCIPIITIGPSLTALYHCTLRMVKGNLNGVTKTFFRTFRENFFQSCIIWIGLLFTGGLLLLNMRFLSKVETLVSLQKPLLFFSKATLGLLILFMLYVFPVLAAFSNTTGNILKNAFLFSVMHFPSTIGIALITLLPLYMTYMDLKLLPLYACCWFFFGFSLVAYISSFLFYRMFKPYLEKEEKTENPVSGNP